MDIQMLTKGKHGIKMLTGNLRWNNGVLEQEAAFQDYDEGELVGSRVEWNPVPSIPSSLLKTTENP